MLMTTVGYNTIIPMTIYCRLNDIMISVTIVDYNTIISMTIYSKL